MFRSAWGGFLDGDQCGTGFLVLGIGEGGVDEREESFAILAAAENFCGGVRSGLADGFVRVKLRDGEERLELFVAGGAADGKQGGNGCTMIIGGARKLGEGGDHGWIGALGEHGGDEFRADFREDFDALCGEAREASGDVRAV